MRLLEKFISLWLVVRANRARDCGLASKAAVLYEAALLYRSDRNGIRVQLGNMLKDSGEWAKAEEVYRQAIRVSPSDADVHLQMGHVLKLGGKWMEALESYKKAAQLDPNCTALREIAYLLSIKGSQIKPTPRLALGSNSAVVNTGMKGSLGPQEVRREIWENNLFDRTWYLKRYPLVQNSALDPLDHYLTEGEKIGFDPSPRFRVFDYLEANPDVIDTGLGALEHYALIGIRERRPLSRYQLHVELPETSQIKKIVLNSANRLAVVVHVYHAELWDEIHEYLSNLPEGFDLFVSLVQGQSDHLESKVSRSFAAAFVLKFPNHGRDIYPFVYLCNSGMLQKYDAICKIHSKKSPHRDDGEQWRQTLLKSLLGSNDRIRKIIRLFGPKGEVGVVAGDRNALGCAHLGINRNTLDALAERGRVPYDVRKIRFAGGSMFWIHPEVVSLISALKLSETDFEPEAGQVDGTMAHALERFIGVLAQSAGYQVVSSDEV